MENVIYLLGARINAWDGKYYETIWDFIRGFKSSGMPLSCDNETDPEKNKQCKCNVCKLQNVHGLLTDDCYNLNCNN